MISKYQWANLKAGDIFITPHQRERAVLDYNNQSNMVTLEKISGNGKTAYSYSDLYKTYSVKPSPQNCRIKKCDPK